MSVRPAEPRDDAAVGELLVQAFVETYARKMPEVVVNEARRAELRATTIKRSQATVLVADWANEVVGTVALFPPGAPTSEAWLPNAADLRHLALKPHLQGQGLSSALLNEAERIAQGWGVSAICLHVRRGAHGIARLYQRRGFVRDPSGDLDKLPAVFLEAYAKSFHNER